jgi:hypothetical protein
MAMGSESGNRKRKKRLVRVMLTHRYGERTAFITVGAFQDYGAQGCR